MKKASRILGAFSGVVLAKARRWSVRRSAVRDHHRSSGSAKLPDTLKEESDRKSVETVGITFRVQFIGLELVNDPYDESGCRRTLRKHGKAGKEKSHPVLLSLSSNKVEIIQLPWFVACEHTVTAVSACYTDLRRPRLFAYIVKDYKTENHICLAFKTLKRTGISGSRLQNAFSHAFKCCVEEPESSTSHLENVTDHADTPRTPRRAISDGHTHTRLAQRRLFRSNSQFSAVSDLSIGELAYHKHIKSSSSNISRDAATHTSSTSTSNAGSHNRDTTHTLPEKEEDAVGSSSGLGNSSEEVSDDSKGCVRRSDGQVLCRHCRCRLQKDIQRSISEGYLHISGLCLYSIPDPEEIGHDATFCINDHDLDMIQDIIAAGVDDLSDITDHDPEYSQRDASAALQDVVSGQTSDAELLITANKSHCSCASKSNKMAPSQTGIPRLDGQVNLKHSKQLERQTAFISLPAARRVSNTSLCSSTISCGHSWSNFDQGHKKNVLLSCSLDCLNMRESSESNPAFIPLRRATWAESADFELTAARQDRLSTLHGISEQNSSSLTEKLLIQESKQYTSSLSCDTLPTPPPRKKPLDYNSILIPPSESKNSSHHINVAGSSLLLAKDCNNNNYLPLKVTCSSKSKESWCQNSSFKNESTACSSTTSLLPPPLPPQTYKLRSQPNMAQPVILNGISIEERPVLPPRERRILPNTAMSAPNCYPVNSTTNACQCDSCHACHFKRLAHVLQTSHALHTFRMPLPCNEQGAMTHTLNCFIATWKN